MWKSCIPPTFRKGKTEIAKIIIPIPPSHCNRALQIRIPFGCKSKSLIIVDPVVVIPLIDSNIASAKLKFVLANIKGIEHINAITIHDMPVKKKAPFKFNFICASLFIIMSEPPTTR